ncbi:MAG: hypothetical protein ACLSHC_09710 [Bilophila wadsworthia]
MLGPARLQPSGRQLLAETVVSGRYIGSKMVEYLKGSESVFKTEPVNDAHKLVAKTIDDIISCRNGKENCFDLRNAMQDVMMDDVGIFRNARISRTASTGCSSFPSGLSTSVCTAA